MPAATSTAQLPAVVPESVQMVELRCFSYEDRRAVLAALLDAVLGCGCWIAEKRALSTWQMEFRFEAELSVVDDLYTSLVGAGVEFTREAHLAMTWLCTLRRHEPRGFASFRTVSVRLEMSFLEECDLEMGMMPTAYA
jgi:hypothetical protein